MSSTVLNGKSLLVVGLGVTGRAVLGAMDSLQGEASPKSVKTFDGLAPDADYNDVSPVDFSQLDLLIASPGWAPSSPVIASALDAGVEVWSEIELAWRLRVDRLDGTKAPWLGITGTNGKTTTVGMLESILNADGRNAVAVGNVGRPVIEVALDPSIDVVALELSSFQLHFTHTLALDAAAVLNIAPDHIDWHGSYEAYVADKGRIYERVTRACVYNIADNATRKLVENADVADGARAVGFTLGSPGRSDVGLVEDVLVDRAFHMDVSDPQRHQNAAEIATLLDLEHLASGDSIPPHIVANALAAAALARAVGVSQSAVRTGLQQYVPGGHRIARVATKKTEDGGSVQFVDDSKATNAHAAAASLSSFADGSVVWIAGGLAKGASFEDLVSQISPKLRATVVIGLDQKPWRDAFQANGNEFEVHYVNGYFADGTKRSGDDVMAEAVALAGGIARSGETVLMAPACASMDQFRTYAERGDSFARIAHEYAREGSKN